eukprot:GILJ01005003.1.p1 GENE.GILJ01005003.1~~GILJ01005003.1.p1  ORF type:complete len:1401 (-),score=258.18 GILJ01005003.1:259-4374(-)
MAICVLFALYSAAAMSTTKALLASTTKAAKFQAAHQGMLTTGSSSRMEPDLSLQDRLDESSVELDSQSTITKISFGCRLQLKYVADVLTPWYSKCPLNGIAELHKMKEGDPLFDAIMNDLHRLNSEYELRLFARIAYYPPAIAAAKKLLGAVFWALRSTDTQWYKKFKKSASVGAIETDKRTAEETIKTVLEEGNFREALSLVYNVLTGSRQGLKFLAHEADKIPDLVDFEYIEQKKQNVAALKNQCRDDGSFTTPMLESWLFIKRLDHLTPTKRPIWVSSKHKSVLAARVGINDERSVSPALSPREEALLYKTDRPAFGEPIRVVNWFPGRYKVRLNYSPLNDEKENIWNSFDWVNLNKRIGHRVLAGPSGTADLFMQAASLFKFSLEEKLALRLALLAWMQDDHSFIEVMAACEPYGLAYHSILAQHGAPGAWLHSFRGLMLTPDELQAYHEGKMTETELNNNPFEKFLVEGDSKLSTYLKLCQPKIVARPEHIAFRQSRINGELDAQTWYDPRTKDLCGKLLGYQDPTSELPLSRMEDYTLVSTHMFWALEAVDQIPSSTVFQRCTVIGIPQSLNLFDRKVKSFTDIKDMSSANFRVFFKNINRYEVVEAKVDRSSSLEKLSCLKIHYANEEGMYESMLNREKEFSIWLCGSEKRRLAVQKYYDKRYESAPSFFKTFETVSWDMMDTWYKMADVAEEVESLLNRFSEDPRPPMQIMRDNRELVCENDIPQAKAAVRGEKRFVEFLETLICTDVVNQIPGSSLPDFIMSMWAGLNVFEDQALWAQLAHGIAFKLYSEDVGLKLLKLAASSDWINEKSQTNKEILLLSWVLDELTHFAKRAPHYVFDVDVNEHNYKPSLEALSTDSKALTAVTSILDEFVRVIMLAFQQPHLFPYLRTHKQETFTGLSMSSEDKVHAKYKLGDVITTSFFRSSSKSLSMTFLFARKVDVQQPSKAEGRVYVVLRYQPHHRHIDISRYSFKASEMEVLIPPGQFKVTRKRRWFNNELTQLPNPYRNDLKLPVGVIIEVFLERVPAQSDCSECLEYSDMHQWHWDFTPFSLETMLGENTWLVKSEEDVSSIIRKFPSVQTSALTAAGSYLTRQISSIPICSSEEVMQHAYSLYTKRPYIREFSADNDEDVTNIVGSGIKDLELFENGLKSREGVTRLLQSDSKVRVQLLIHMMLDWIIVNLDSLNSKFIFDSNGDLCSIDKSGSFKHVAVAYRRYGDKLEEEAVKYEPWLKDPKEPQAYALMAASLFDVLKLTEPYFEVPKSENNFPLYPLLDEALRQADLSADNWELVGKFLDELWVLGTSLREFQPPELLKAFEFVQPIELRPVLMNAVVKRVTAGYEVFQTYLCKDIQAAKVKGMETHC